MVFFEHFTYIMDDIMFPLSDGLCTPWTGHLFLYILSARRYVDDIPLTRTTHVFFTSFQKIVSRSGKQSSWSRVS